MCLRGFFFKFVAQAKDYVAARLSSTDTSALPANLNYVIVLSKVLGMSDLRSLHDISRSDKP